jgi:hypothetical protein
MINEYFYTNLITPKITAPLIITSEIMNTPNNILTLGDSTIYNLTISNLIYSPNATINNLNVDNLIVNNSSNLNSGGLNVNGDTTINGDLNVNNIVTNNIIVKDCSFNLLKNVSDIGDEFSDIFYFIYFFTNFLISDLETLLPIILGSGSPG